MGKQRTQERIRAGENTIGHVVGEQPRVAGGVPALFEDHYRLSVRSMTPEHAAAVAHEAVQRHLASVREAGGSDPMP